MTVSNLTVFGQERVGEKSDWFTALGLELQTEADRTSEQFLATRAGGVMLAVVLDNVAGTPAITPKIVVPSPDTTVIPNDIVVGTFSAISSSGVTVCVFHEHASGMGDTCILGALPREWKLQLVHGGADTTHRADTEVYARYI